MMTQHADLQSVKFRSPQFRTHQEDGLISLHFNSVKMSSKLYKRCNTNDAGVLGYYNYRRMRTREGGADPRAHACIRAGCTLLAVSTLV